MYKQLYNNLCASLCTWLHEYVVHEFTCVVCDGSSRHWLYKPIVKPRMQLTKFFVFFAAYRK